MVQCCKRSSDQIDVWKVQQSRLDFLCTKPLVYTSAITALAIAILGAFALLGFFYPMSSLGSLADLLGDIGVYTSLGVGLVLFTTIIFARCCHSKARIEEKTFATTESTFFETTLSSSE